jgi:ergothioneine biosynthesis protein EgtB
LVSSRLRTLPSGSFAPQRSRCRRPREFTFDNEGPAHDVYLQGFEIARRPVTNAEFLAFIDDDGYGRPEFWLSDGWNVRAQNGWTAPLYWERQGASWSTFTLHGERPLEPQEPVCHVSYYEADTFARWAEARLPTKAEWEAVASNGAPIGNFLDSERLHPAAAGESFFGDVWVWTASPYVAYPGYRPARGALGERQVDVQSIRPSRRLLRDAGGTCASDVSQFLSTGRAVAVHGAAAGEGPVGMSGRFAFSILHLFPGERMKNAKPRIRNAKSIPRLLPSPEDARGAIIAD